ncbi:dual specificity protein phosphatase family protein [Rhizobium tumorigenes]|uniref:Dual specificity protein phosphatase family protein n=1 Tax=Rhizobium tumorigenes TaxID=2041385 RepID=A0AAF1K933_9HYPH|nr:dual specificity protein phosphatase family protein [Rhizobium tumorigenes]WFR94817.1 dual specificity protein phosphatase family protein [Rhizobium tumorigenes]WFS00306.1 dual specificity protein phosphatase family protein [Rhizobium tumorigenes]
MAILGRIRKIMRYAVACFLVGLLFFGGHLALLQATGNFHTVIPGQLYRSAQPSGAQLETYVHQYGIKTIVNLRGSNDQPWYQEETAVARRLGVQHIDFRMSATKILTVDKAIALIDIMKTAPRPILVHCMSGADRTGLFSLIYSYEVAGVPGDVAEWQLSVLFGHIGVPYLSASFAMDRSWQDLEHHLDVKQGG